MSKPEIDRINPFKIPATDITIPELDLSQGEVIIIQGKNGSGKTSILKYIYENYDSLMLEQEYDSIIYPYLKVYESIALPLIIEDKKAKINRPISHYVNVSNQIIEDFGLDMSPQKQSWQLSGGEKHLMLIARFMLTAKKLLLLDEPTTGLDSNKEKLFWDVALKKLARAGKQIILISHSVPDSIKFIRSLSVIGFNEKIISVKTTVL